MRTACTYDCPDACGLTVESEGDGLRLSGDPDHPITRGFVCRRIRRHLARLHSPRRLRSPLVRRGDRLEPIGWDEALELAATRLADALHVHGAPSVVHVQGGGSLGLSKLLVGHFFHSLGPITTLRGGLCGEAGEEAQRLDFGDRAGHDYTDLANSRAIVLWGKNAAATGIHLVPFVKEARARGAKVVLVEVRGTETTFLADRAVQVRPGGDGFLALAVLRTLLDRGAISTDAIARTDGWQEHEALLRSHSLEWFAEKAGAPLEDIAYLAELHADSHPVASLVGWGLQRRRTGAFCVRCIDALGVLSGNVGVPGGGVTFTSWRRRGLDLSSLAKATGRSISAAAFGRGLAALRDPPARFVYVCAANPVNQMPDSKACAHALRQAGFVVVADAFLTDTAAQADLVLPVALMLEEDDAVGSYAHHHVARVSRAVEPPEGVRGDLWILRELHRRLGLPRDPVLAEPQLALERIVAPWFAQSAQPVLRSPQQPEIPFRDRFATPSGRMQLVTDLPTEEPIPEAYPLTLGSFSHQAWQTSQLPEDEQTGLPLCFANPASARAAGIGDGERARLVSPLGALQVEVRLDSTVGPELCVLHRGGWVRHGRGVNTLVAAVETDVGEGAAFYDQRVRLEPVR